ncbi:hypothetical protein MLD38_034155 [Melastoma candidum]|uniref:Uncharacterized protein n=1 Tax=Melastoma candidum TaxID=119954 RepID=A0ACB9MB60_9MYRT|nr:hypothetical protein MLD38_034155 [Melastoma candidum]
MDPSFDDGKSREGDAGGSVDDGERRASYPPDVSASRRNLLDQDSARKRFSDSFTALPGRMKFLQLGSASARFKRIAEERDLMSRAVGSSGSHKLRHRIGSAFAHKIDWANLVKMSREWIRDPMNMALFLWIACVGVSGAILFLVMTGMLNRELPKKSQRDAWFEVNNQILNALFTLMCLYQHPKRFYHLVLLCRWKPEDIAKLRKVYCKNGTYKPHEWAHMMVVVILLHINCFAQYALCGLNLGYKRSQRPAVGVAICISVAIGAPAFAGLYTIMSPLGRDYDSGSDEESQLRVPGETVEIQRLRVKSFEKRLSFAVKEENRVVEVSPKWSGGIFDFWDDIALAYLSLFCSFCVFGWNMERVGFGNMYVHIATFILFCTSPFWILNLAAVNIDNESAREALSVTGIILCLFGLLYGGFWRIQMRRRFNLPAYTFCCGKPSVTDCALWLCCCWCSLAQEVRTVNSYDIVEEKFCLKHGKGPDDEPGGLSPLPNEDRVFELRPSPKSPSNGFASSPSPSRFYQSPGTSHGFASSPSPSRFYQSPDMKLSSVMEESADTGKDEIMRPPSPLVIQKEKL